MSKLVQRSTVLVELATHGSRGFVGRIATFVCQALCLTVLWGALQAAHAQPLLIEADAGIEDAEYSDADWGDMDDDGDLDLLVVRQFGSFDAIPSSPRIYENDGSGTLTDTEARLPNTGTTAEWTDLDGDGDLDIVLAGDRSGTLLFVNDGSGNFREAGAGLTGVQESASSVGDVNGDGNLDLVVTGDYLLNTEDDVDSTPTATLYLGDGTGGFTPADAGLTGVHRSASAFGDVNNDDILDLVLTGSDSEFSSESATVYLGDGSGGFSPAGADLTGRESGSVSLGDVDNDDNLDLVLTGYDESRNESATLYLGDGTGGFTEQSAGLTGVIHGSSTLVDVNDDDNLDLLITGRAEGRTETAALYIGDGSGGFTEKTDAGLTGVEFSSSSAADVNGDTHPDLLITGEDDGGAESATLYLNDGAGVFTAAGASLTGVMRSSSAIGDVDNDGNLDLLYTGENAGKRTLLYLGDGSGGFTEQATELAGVSEGSTVFGDVDGDSNLDLVLTGEGTSLLVADVYRGDGSGGFSALKPQLTGLSDGAIASADFDGNGHMDLLLSGTDSDLNERTILYENDGGDLVNAFSEAGARLTGSANGSISVSDFDGNGAPDIFLSGENADNDPFATLYTNDNSGDLSSAFSDASAALTAVQNSSSIAADLVGTDAPDLLVTGTPSGSNSDATTILYENDGSGSLSAADAGFTGFVGAVDVGDVDADGDQDVALSGANGSGDGVALYTNDGGGSFSSFDAGISAKNGLVAWGDSDDNGYDDLFVTGQDDDFNQQASLYQSLEPGTEPIRFEAFASLPALVDFGDAAWGDYDNDGDLDVVVTGRTENPFSGPDERTTTLFRNDDGSFTAVNAGLTDVRSGAAAWGDYDGDEDLDLVVAGAGTTGDVATIYRNDGSDTFTAIDASLSGGEEDSAPAWADFDSDGDLDLLIAGQESTELYRNDGNGTFTPTGPSLPLIDTGNLDVGDYDGDGDPDVMLTGKDGVSFVGGIYRNDGSGHFTNVGGVPDLQDSAMDWGDYDNDGDLDVAIMGIESPATEVTVIKRNGGNGTFTSISAGLTPQADGDLAWGDADADGDLDLYVTGQDEDFSTTSTLYRNDGGGTFTAVNPGITPYETGSVDWGDMDGDGDLDLLATGLDSFSDRQTTIFENTFSINNAAPTAPSNITATVVNRAAGAVRFEWDAATDAGSSINGATTPQDGLSYHVFLKEESAGTYIGPPHADPTSGMRYLVAPDNATAGTETTFRDLDESTQYSVGVQALDHSFAGSGFATTLFDASDLAADASSSQSVSDDGTVDFGGTGVDITFSGTSSSGTVTVEKFNEAPLGSDGISETNVSEYSFVLDVEGDLTFDDNTEVRMDVSILRGVSDPTEVVVYKRETAGGGPFTALTTTVEDGGTPDDISDDVLVATTGSFSEFVLASNTNGLPVDLAAFDAQRDDDTVRLTWTTASETNNAGFEVQRRTPSTPDGRPTAWTRLQRVEGAGTTAEATTYRFTDQNLPFTAETVAYRLKQVDTDGTASYSDPITVDLGTPTRLVLRAPFPNPVRGQATLRYGLPQSTAVTIRLYNVLGQQIATLVDGRQEAGRKEVTLNAGRLSSGVYFVRMQAGETVHTQRMTVIR